jgi:hypothetical protein
MQQGGRSMGKATYYIISFTGTGFMITHTGDNLQLVEEYATNLPPEHTDIKIYGEFIPGVFTIVKEIVR